VVRRVTVVVGGVNVPRLVDVDGVVRVMTTTRGVVVVGGLKTCVVDVLPGVNEVALITRTVRFVVDPLRTTITVGGVNVPVVEVGVAPVLVPPVPVPWTTIVCCCCCCCCCC
jgi:hypothetical protein